MTLHAFSIAWHHSTKPKCARVKVARSNLISRPHVRNGIAADVKNVIIEATARSIESSIGRLVETQTVLSSELKEKLTLAGDDQREVWRISNALLHRCGKQQNTDNSESLCLSFRQFFIGKLQMIRAKIRLELISYGFVLLNLMAKPAQVLDSFMDTTPAEVAKVISGIKCKNSSTDIIPTIVIKRCVDVFALALSYAINMSFLSGHFPRIFKIGHVVPLLKKPGSDVDVSDPSNYRPITNLSTIPKVFEKLALTRLRPHLHGSSNFSSHQSAYRSGHSTETATLKVTDDLNSNMDNKSCSLFCRA